jgi:hypothetical protein
VDAVTRDPGVLLEKSHRRVTRNPVRRTAAHVMVRARVLQKARNEPGTFDRRLSGSLNFYHFLQTRPAGKAVLGSERALNVAKSRAGRRLGQCTIKARARRGYWRAVP